jgi:choline-sulfatase
MTGRLAGCRGWKAAETSPPGRIMARLRICIFALLATLLATGCGREHGNVVLIMVDTLRADHLSCYGGEGARTPSIDGIAREGCRFTGVHSAAPTTLASTSSLMTSVYPRIHGALRNDCSLNESNRTLAEVLRDAGWSTAGFAASFALTAGSGIAQGFLTYDESFSGRQGSYVPQRRAGEVNAAVARWLEAGPQEPFFLFIHYFDPHVPYTPPAPWSGAGNEADTTGITGSLEDVKLLKDYLGEGGAVDRRAERMRDLYRGEVEYTDHEVGVLLGLLEEQGLLENTLVVFTADHGETFWEHREMGEYFDHGYMVYETTTHIPLIIRRPGDVPAGMSADAPASNIDIAPTVLDLLGVEAPGDFEGVSLVPAMRGGTLPERPIFCEATKPYGRIEYGAAFKNDFKPKCVWMGDLKLIWMPFYDDRQELYDLARDPGELDDLTQDGRADERARGMRTVLERWAHEGSLLARNSRSRVDPRTRSMLKALGYVQGEDGE